MTGDGLGAAGGKVLPVLPVAEIGLYSRELLRMNHDHTYCPAHPNPKHTTPAENREQTNKISRQRLVLGSSAPPHHGPHEPRSRGRESAPSSLHKPANPASPPTVVPSSPLPSVSLYLSLNFFCLFRLFAAIPFRVVRDLMPQCGLVPWGIHLEAGLGS